MYNFLNNCHRYKFKFADKALKNKAFKKRIESFCMFYYCRCII